MFLNMLMKQCEASTDFIMKEYGMYDNYPMAKLISLPDLLRKEFHLTYSVRVTVTVEHDQKKTQITSNKKTVITVY